MIVDLCPQFARSDHVTSQHSINFAGGGALAIKKPYNRGKGRGRGGGRGGRGAGASYQKQVTRDIIYPKGQLPCSIVGLSVGDNNIRYTLQSKLFQFACAIFGA